MTKEFEDRLRAALDESVAHLDGRVRSRLTQARHAALDEMQRRSRRAAWWRPAVPVAAFGAAAVIAIMTWTHRPEVAAPPTAATAARDVLLAPEEAMTPEAAGQGPALALLTGDDVDFLLGEDLFEAALVEGEPAG